MLDIQNPTLTQHIPFMLNWILHILSSESTKAMVTFGNLIELALWCLLPEDSVVAIFPSKYLLSVQY